MSHHGPVEDRYAIVPRRVWDDMRAAGIEAPAPSPATLLIWLITSPAARVPGVVPLGRLSVAEAIGWEPHEVDACIAPLVEAGLVLVDWRARLICVPATLRRDAARVSSAPQVVSWRRDVLGLPACTLTNTVDAEIRAHLRESFLPHYEQGERVGNPAGNPVGKRVSESESESDSQLEIEKERERAADSPDGSPPVPVSSFGSKRQSRKAEKEAEPLPYSVEELQQALASTSGGRYVVVEPTKRQTKGAETIIRKCGIESIKLTGAWLKAGGEDWRNGVDIRSVEHFAAWIEHAKQWDASGRPPLTKQASGHSPSRPNRPAIFVPKRKDLTALATQSLRTIKYDDDDKRPSSPSFAEAMARQSSSNGELTEQEIVSYLTDKLGYAPSPGEVLQFQIELREHLEYEARLKRGAVPASDDRPVVSRDATDEL
jgi:hypothetical protein